MAGYQYTVIVGNVGRDPEFRYTPSGVAVCEFSVAVSRHWTDRTTNEERDKTTWFRVKAWRQLGETCNQFVHKGMQILVAGEIEVSAFQGQDGQPRASLELTARDVKFLGRREDREGITGDEPSQADDLPF